MGVISLNGLHQGLADALLLLEEDPQLTDLALQHSLARDYLHSRSGGPDAGGHAKTERGTSP